MRGILAAVVATAIIAMAPTATAAGVKWLLIGGVTLQSEISIGAHLDNKLVIVARGIDGKVWRRCQAVAGDPSSWSSPWQQQWPLGGDSPLGASDPTVIGFNLDGTPNSFHAGAGVFVRGGEGEIWTTWRKNQDGDCNDPGEWSPWTRVSGDGAYSQPETQSLAIGSHMIGNTTGYNYDAHFSGSCYFARGIDNALWMKCGTIRYGSWRSWQSLGGVLTSNPTAFVNKNGVGYVFARGTDNSVWYIKLTAPDKTQTQSQAWTLTWGAWQPLGGKSAGDVAVGQNVHGELEIFIRDLSGTLMHRRETSVGGDWSRWVAVPGHGGTLTTDPTVCSQADGRLEVFVRGQDSAVWQTGQIDELNWSSWSSLGGVSMGKIACALNHSSDGTPTTLELFGVGTNFQAWHTWQTSPNGGWLQ
jgi:hypothetical protein